MNKKIMSLLIASAIILSAFAGCNSNDGNASDSTGSDTSAAAPAENTESKATEAEDTKTDTEAENTKADTSEAEQGGEASEGDTVTKIADAIKAAYGDDYLPNMPMDEEMIGTVFGLEADSYTEIFAETPMISAQPDTLLIVKAAEGKGDTVKSALDAYRSRLVNDTMQYPMNLPKINASQVVVNGDYYAFILLGAYSDDLDDAPEEEQAKFAEEQEQIGIDAFNKYFE
ncbi:MAG: DUF4358 domain-containing protein [Firmicutes bacterium]|nr:DUF4358 domain-containing protein [[Eubacterium] siraeum]MCM1487137.1 DUF4358 domain-containing protein [Bacillota bacterium]